MAPSRAMSLWNAMQAIMLKRKKNNANVLKQHYFCNSHIKYIWDQLRLFEMIRKGNKDS